MKGQRLSSFLEILMYVCCMYSAFQYTEATKPYSKPSDLTNLTCNTNKITQQVTTMQYQMQLYIAPGLERM